MPISAPKERRERRIGERLFLKGERSLSAKAAMARRPFPPGIHGKAFRRGRSEFSTQLREKQKVRYLYGITDTKLKRYFLAARRAKGRPTVEGLAMFLESRLDNAVCRAGFALSRSIARHLVTYGHVAVNGRRVRQPGFQLRAGDAIRLVAPERSSALYDEIKKQWEKSATTPEWLSCDRRAGTATVVRSPNLGDIMTQQNMALIVEYYSR